MKPDSIRVRLGKSLVEHSKDTKQPLWSDLAKDLLASRKNRPVVNLSTIARNTKEDAIVVVPGKILGAGLLEHRVTVAAYSFSIGAREKIRAKGGQCLRLQDFMESTKSTSGVIILG